MSLSKPMKTSAYRIRRNRFVESVDAIIDRIERYWPHLLMLAVFVLWAAVMEADYKELTAADKRATEDAQAQRDEAADWNRHNRVRLVLEGPRESVANMAQQFANLPK